MKNVLRAVAGIALLSFAACTGESAGPGGNGLIEVQLSGGGAGVNLALEASSMAPPGTDLIASATVEIGAVQLVSECGEGEGEEGDGECEGSIVTLTESGGTYDLLDLQSGVNATLASATVPAGTYFQLRLVVLSASVTLVDGVTFPDGSSSADLVVPSGAQSGIKIHLSDDDEEPGLTVDEGGVIVLLELDVSRNFVLTGPPDSPRRALFTPSVRQVTGS